MPGAQRIYDDPHNGTLDSHASQRKSGGDVHSSRKPLARFDRSALEESHWLRNALEADSPGHDEGCAFQATDRTADGQFNVIEKCLRCSQDSVKATKRGRRDMDSAGALSKARKEHRITYQRAPAKDHQVTLVDERLTSSVGCGVCGRGLDQEVAVGTGFGDRLDDRAVAESSKARPDLGPAAHNGCQLRAGYSAFQKAVSDARADATMANQSDPHVSGTPLRQAMVACRTLCPLRRHGPG
jgi:hypothetical protein